VAADLVGESRFQGNGRPDDETDFAALSVVPETMPFTWLEARPPYFLTGVRRIEIEVGHLLLGRASPDDLTALCHDF
jgi:hypothetical protein